MNERPPSVSPPPSAPGGDVVRFYLDGTEREVRGVDPNRTVLDYLREDLGRTGTKEGCAEGDCGACTVVLAESDGDRVSFRAVNSCIQFVPTLDGKELFTVESLRSADGALHPVQRAMVDCHASQCGFCTPGFVMSLFALYRSESVASGQRVRDALAGNLCRCTGYRPILAAAREMYGASAQEDHWLRRPFEPRPSDDEREMARRLGAIRRPGTFEYRAEGGFGEGRRTRRFMAPESLAELAELRLRFPRARLLAGGTDVGLWVTKEHRDLDEILYVGNVAELRGVEASDTHLEIGAAATLAELEEPLGRHHPDLGEILRRFGSPPIRNVATLGGNVANGSPIGDSMPALIALGASLVLRRGEETRELPLDRFYLGYRETALRKGELIERIRVPVGRPEVAFGTYKVSKRFDQDISAVCGAYALRLDEGVIREARVCYGGMAAVPQRAVECERALAGAPWTEETVERGMRAIERDYEPITDMRASAAYRLAVARNLLRRFFLETSGFDERTGVLQRSAGAG